MSDHNERACTKCGSLTHHEDDCSRATHPTSSTRPKDGPGDAKGRGLPEDVRAFIEEITLWLQKQDDAQRTTKFNLAYKLYLEYDVEGWSAKRRSAMQSQEKAP